MDWFDKAEDQIAEEYNNGDIDDKEYKSQMRSLRQEHEEARQDAAQEAYDNY